MPVERYKNQDSFSLVDDFFFFFFFFCSENLCYSTLPSTPFRIFIDRTMVLIKNGVICGCGSSCRWTVGFCWDNSEFHFWHFLFSFFFLFLMPLSCSLLLFVGSCKRIKDGRTETRILLYSNFISRFTILWCGMFSWTSRSSHISQTSC